MQQASKVSRDQRGRQGGPSTVQNKPNECGGREKAATGRRAALVVGDKRLVDLLGLRCEAKVRSISGKQSGKQAKTVWKSCIYTGLTGDGEQVRAAGG